MIGADLDHTHNVIVLIIVRPVDENPESDLIPEDHLRLDPGHEVPIPRGTGVGRLYARSSWIGRETQKGVGGTPAGYPVVIRSGEDARRLEEQLRIVVGVLAQGIAGLLETRPIAVAFRTEEDATDQARVVL